MFLKSKNVYFKVLLLNINTCLSFGTSLYFNVNYVYSNNATKSMLLNTSSTQPLTFGIWFVSLDVQTSKY